jgi:hypothetical protein
MTPASMGWSGAVRSRRAKASSVIKALPSSPPVFRGVILAGQPSDEPIRPIHIGLDGVRDFAGRHESLPVAGNLRSEFFNIPRGRHNVLLRVGPTVSMRQSSQTARYFVPRDVGCEVTPRETEGASDDVAGKTHRRKDVAGLVALRGAGRPVGDGDEVLQCDQSGLGIDA